MFLNIFQVKINIFFKILCTFLKLLNKLKQVGEKTTCFLIGSFHKTYKKVINIKGNILSASNTLYGKRRKKI